MKSIFLPLWSLILAWPLFAFGHSAHEFKVATYNIRNFAALNQEPSDFRILDAPTDAKAFSETIQELDSAIIAFQEIINGQLFQRLLSASLPEYQLIMSECGGTADQKVALAFDPRIFELDRYEEDWRVALSNRCNYGLRPALIVWLRHRATRKKMAFIVVHLKAGSGDRNRSTRRDQHYVISDILKDLKQQNLDEILVLGDFNTTSYFEQTPGAAQFAAFIRDNELINAGQNLGCTSYWEGDRGDGKMWPSHLDHILHRGSAQLSEAAALTHCARHNCQPVERALLGASFEGISDHCPVRVQINLAR